MNILSRTILQESKCIQVDVCNITNFKISQAGLSLTILDYHGLSKTITVYHGVSQTIPDYPWLSLTIPDYHGLSQTIMDYHRLSLTITVYHRVSRTIPDYHGLSRTITDYCKQESAADWRGGLQDWFRNLYPTPSSSSTEIYSSPQFLNFHFIFVFVNRQEI